MAVIWILIKPRDQKILDEKAIARGESKRCPYCAELIKAEALVCRYCHRELDLHQIATSNSSKVRTALVTVESVSDDSKTTTATSSSRSRFGAIVVILLILFVIAFAAFMQSINEKVEPKLVDISQSEYMLLPYPISKLVVSHGYRTGEREQLSGWRIDLDNDHLSDYVLFVGPSGDKPCANAVILGREPMNLIEVCSSQNEFGIYETFLDQLGTSFISRVDEKTFEFWTLADFHNTDGEWYVSTFRFNMKDNRYNQVGKTREETTAPTKI